MIIIVLIVIDNMVPFILLHLWIKLAEVVKYVRENNYYYKDKKNQGDQQPQTSNLILI